MSGWRLLASRGVHQSNTKGWVGPEPEEQMTCAGGAFRVVALHVCFSVVFLPYQHSSLEGKVTACVHFGLLLMLLHVADVGM